MKLAAFLCVVLARVASAGLVYDFNTTIDTSRASQMAIGTVWVRGDCYRAEVRQNGATSIVISCDADKSAMILEPRTRTYRNRARVSSDVRSAAIFLWPFPDRKVTGRPKVSYKRGETEPVAGEPTVRHAIDAEFKVLSRYDDAPIRGTYTMNVRLWTAERLAKLPMDRPLRTGYEEVDAELEKIAPKIAGMILRSELEVSRRYEGGKPDIEKTVTIITRLEETDVPDSQFEVPKDYTYAGPATITTH
jgi:hypothetical protein